MSPPPTMPDHRGGDRERSRRRHAGRFEQRREGEAGGRPAGQRHRAGEHAHQRMLAEGVARADADDVLQRPRARCESRKKTSTCGPPTRSSDRLAPKPIVVKNAIISGACSVVSKVTSGHAAPSSTADQRPHDQQPADHRRRHVVAREQRHGALDAVADEQDDAGEGERLDESRGSASTGRGGWCAGANGSARP